MLHTVSIISTVSNVGIKIIHEEGWDMQCLGIGVRRMCSIIFPAPSNVTPFKKKSADISCLVSYLERGGCKTGMTVPSQHIWPEWIGSLDHWACTSSEQSIRANMFMGLEGIRCVWKLCFTVEIQSMPGHPP